ncbi:hypothetical protein C0J52_02450 [Blattella germanica]|nr:hypothetical protein C0J52_02450 [Blattella germanica]
MEDAIATCDAAISEGDAALVSDTSLNLEPEFRDPEYSRIAMVNGGSPVEHSFSSILEFRLPALSCVIAGEQQP